MPHGKPPIGNRARTNSITPQPAATVVAHRAGLSVGMRHAHRAKTSGNSAWETTRGTRAMIPSSAIQGNSEVKNATPKPAPAAHAAPGRAAERIGEDEGQPGDGTEEEGAHGRDRTILR